MGALGLWGGFQTSVRRAANCAQMLLGATLSRLGSLHTNVPGLATLLLAAALTLGYGHAFGQQQENKDHVAVLELGAAGAWGLGDGTASCGPCVAVEVTPIEHWLEIEAGISAISVTNSRRQCPPQWCHTRNSNSPSLRSGSSSAAQFAAPLQGPAVHTALFGISKCVTLRVTPASQALP
jgi:hypothetical protein